MLSVIIPVYNEVKNIDLLIERVLAVNILKEIIIVDDGSTDGTRAKLEKYASMSNFKVVLHKTNQGKGAAIRTGILEVSGSVTIIQDADLEYNPEEYLLIVPPVMNGETKVMYGSRFLKTNNVHSYWYFYAGGQVVTWFTNVLFGQKLTDEPTCYKVFDSELLKSIPLQCTGFEFCPEITAKVAKLGHKIPEIPISYSPRTLDEGKKINWKDGVIAIWTLIKYRIV
jgi:glycosyltransferase involved in cell wall biosynthesis